MSVDYSDAAGVAILLVASGLVVFALYRAVEFRRVLVGRVYKNRASWTVVFLLAILFFFFDTSGYVPYLSSDGGVPGFVVITVSLVLFVDSNIRATQETDFFHRDTLRWRVLGKPAVIAILCSLAIVGLAIVAAGFNSIATWGMTNTSSVWVDVGALQYFLVLGVVLVYGAASLITAGRRTQDRTMRRFVGMLGLSLLGFVLFFTIWIPLSYFGTDASNVGSEVFFIVAAYYLYKAVMSFSPVGRVEVGTGSVPPVSAGVPTSSPAAAPA
jgi:multisubunit Na+/H+ antiporter MnhB subunit